MQKIESSKIKENILSLKEKIRNIQEEIDVKVAKNEIYLSGQNTTDWDENLLKANYQDILILKETQRNYETALENLRNGLNHALKQEEISAVEENIKRTLKISKYTSDQIRKRWQKAADEILYLTILETYASDRITECSKIAKISGIDQKIPYPSETLKSTTFWSHLRDRLQLPCIDNPSNMWPQDSANSEIREKIQLITDEIEAFFIQKGLIK